SVRCSRPREGFGRQTTSADPGSRADLTLVDRAVRELVCGSVLLARDVAYLALPKRREQGTGTKRQGYEAGVLDAPQPTHLLDHEKRVHPHVDRGGSAALGLFEPEDQRAVLGHVVRGVTERTGELRDELSLFVVEHRARAGRTGVATCGAVRVQDQSHSPKSCAIRARSTFPPETIETTRSPGRTAILPASSAAVAAAPAGSATSLARCARKRIPSAMRSSPITTMSATRRRMMSSGMVPAIGAARPSAMVSMRSSRTGFPASSARLIAAAPVGSTPTTRAPGRLAATATAIPALMVTMPRSRCSFDSLDTAKTAPRGLNDPVRWKFSALRYAAVPMRSDSERLEKSGVRWRTGPTTSRARSTSATVTGIAA